MADDGGTTFTDPHGRTWSPPKAQCEHEADEDLSIIEIGSFFGRLTAIAKDASASYPLCVCRRCRCVYVEKEE